MRKIKSLCLIMFILGIIFCILGWIQSMPFSAHSSVYEYVYIRRVAKSYTFALTGGVLVSFSLIIDNFVNKVNEETRVLYEKVAKLEKKVYDLNK